jgi:hypothetical protein
MSRREALGHRPGLPSWAAPQPVPRGDRRMGQRVPTAQLAVTVRYVVPRSRWWRSDVAGAADGFVADMSMTGVGVVAPRNDALRVGSVVALEIRGASGEAIIRRISDVDSTCAHYGLEYGHLVDDFREVVGDLVAPTHQQYDWQWTTAH